MKKRKENRQISFRAALILSYVVIIFVPFLFFAWRSYLTSEKVMIKMAQDNVYQLIDSKNRILDMTFSGVKEASLNLLVDKQLYKELDELDTSDDVAVVEANDVVSDLLRKYFYSYPEVVSVSLVTDFYTYGYSKTDIPFDRSFFQSAIYKKAFAEKGGGLFIPTYNFFKIQGKKSPAEPNLFTEMVFSLVRITNITLVTEQNTSRTLENFTPMPTLLVHFREDTFRKELQQLTSTNGSTYMVLSEDGTVVSHSDASLIGSVYRHSWVQSVLQSKSGVDNSIADGENMIICYDTSPITNWTTVVTIPRGALLSKVLNEIKTDLVMLFVLFVGLASLLSLPLTRLITGSLSNFLKAIKKMGAGDFGIVVEPTKVSEFDYLTTRFNEMSEQIKKLIDENYLVKIRQKESEIAILTAQLNPHFLYNTLNTIQLSNINGEHEKTGKMIIALSRLLNYTADNHEEMKPLNEDFNWLKKYIYIMQCRYEDEFSVHISLNEAMGDCLIPKLFLQPLVENSILHAFKKSARKGKIMITADLTDDQMVFTIEDNGDGMTDAQIAHFFESPVEGIGINNVYTRLKLIYGESCQFSIESELGKFTKTTIILPKRA